MHPGLCTSAGAAKSGAVLPARTETTISGGIAARVLACCLEGRAWAPEDLRFLVQHDSATLFRVIVEALADRFEPSLCEVYARLFSEALAHAVPGLDAAALAARYERIRRPPQAVPEARTVFVLSRVTLGADIAVTSVLLDALKRRFPAAHIVFVGPGKNWELFAGDPRIEHFEAGYIRRGSLAERLKSWPVLQSALNQPDSIVVDPDSRLTQLGLLPVCPESAYFFFESRAYGCDSDLPLPALAAQWAAQTFGVEDARAYIAPAAEPVADRASLVCVSFGVGENPTKRVDGPFEHEVLRYLLKRNATVLVDEGAGGEETGRVLRAIARAGGSHRVRTWRGSFARFAATIARAGLYLGYDSAGQHAAAACGVPLVSVFAGAVTPRFFLRWRPSGPGRIRIVDPAGLGPMQVLSATQAALDPFLHSVRPSAGRSLRQIQRG